MAAPTVLSTVFPDRQGIEDVLGEAGVKWRLDDAMAGVLTSDQEAVLTRLYSEATAWVKYHLGNYDLSDYPAADKAGHWLVYRWACIRAAYLLSQRRGNPAVGSLKAMYDEAALVLEKIKEGKQTLSDVAQFASPSMSVSNARLDDWYRTRKLRVQRPISTPIPARHDQSKDFVSEYIPETNP